MPKRYIVQLTVSLGILTGFILALLPFSWGSSLKETFAQHQIIGTILFVATLISCLDSAYKDGLTHGRFDKERS